MSQGAAGWTDEGPVADLFDLLERPAWWQEAACRTAPPGVSWFPAKGEPVAPAKVICAGCPVREECAAYAAGLDSAGTPVVGVWGGLTGRERRRLRAADRRTPPAA